MRLIFALMNITDLFYLIFILDMSRSQKTASSIKTTPTPQSKPQPTTWKDRLQP